MKVTMLHQMMYKRKNSFWKLPFHSNASVTISLGRDWYIYKCSIYCSIEWAHPHQISPQIKVICPLVKPFLEWNGGNFHASKVFPRLTSILNLKIVWHPVLRNCPCILWAIYYHSSDSYAIYRVSFIRGKEGLLHYRYFIRNENEEK